MKSCAACYKPYRGAGKTATIISGLSASSMRGRVCPSCSKRALTVVVCIGALKVELEEQRLAERRLVQAAKRRQRKQAEPKDDAIPE